MVDSGTYLWNWYLNEFVVHWMLPTIAYLDASSTFSMRNFPSGRAPYLT